MVRPPDHILPYHVYRVSQRSREPLLGYIHEALTASGCSIIYSSDAAHAPFRISFATPTGERMGIVAYAFFANQRVTRNRPADEYRFQLKYGGKQDTNIHYLWQDPYGLYTTLLVGISPTERFFVGFDPVLHSPTKHFISLEFKTSFIDEIHAKGWSWRERDRRSGSEDVVEVIVGGTEKSFLDFVRFEREARGEDQGHRALLAERRGIVERVSRTTTPSVSVEPAYVHQLAREFEMSEGAVLDLIASAKRLKMAVRGWVAEHHLVQMLSGVTGISDCERIDAESSPDIQLRFEGSDLLFVECKNVLRTTASNGAPRVDFQRTRASKGDPCSRYYAPDDFDVLAACLHARTEKWDYSFALTRELDKHRKCAGKLSSNVVLDGRWKGDVRGILGLAAASR
jgi:restriction-modification system family protein